MTFAVRKLPIGLALSAAIALALPGGRGGRADAQPVAATRQGQQFTQLEQTLEAAVARGDAAAAAAMLADDFTLRTARRPGELVPREDFLAAIAAAARTVPAARSTANLVALPLGDGLALVTLTLSAAATAREPRTIAVTDLWRQDGSRWVLVQRHAVVPAASQRGIPGDAGAPPIRRME